MASLQVEDGGHDLERLRGAMPGALRVEELSALERRLRWQVLGASGSTTSTLLRSGLRLSASTVSWEQPWRMAVEHGLSSIKLILMRGCGPRLRTSDGGDHGLRGGLFHMGQIRRPVRLEFEFGEPPSRCLHEQLALEVERERLLEMLGAKALPEPLEQVLQGAGAYPTRALPMGPALFRLFDELLGCDARGASRVLHLEAKGIELLASLVDRIEECARGQAPGLSAVDRERLERARQMLIARLEEAPSLAALARAAGLNEFKLKAGFRALFGRPVHAYLRERRMHEALRLLRLRRYTVTEVATRVGYANPSKFAAAFRKQFGQSPSDLG